MPALSMPTRGAIAYGTEVTCLLRIKDGKAPLFLSEKKLPVGAFCNQQRREEQTWSGPCVIHATVDGFTDQVKMLPAESYMTTIKA